MNKRILFSILVMILMSCGGRNSTIREPSVYSDEGVYSNSKGNMEEVEIESGSTDYLGREGAVDSELLDATMQGSDQLEEWSPVFFEFDRAALSSEARLKLSKYGQQLKNNPSWRILIEGHCDIRGTEAYNQALGEKRAESVRRFLLDLGVELSQMNTISYGELKPLLARDGEEAWTLNRRAEFRIQK